MNIDFSRLRPLGDRHLVKIIVPEQISEGGIYMVQEEEELLIRGTVMSLGLGYTGDLKEGDIVYFEKIRALVDEGYALIVEKNILGKED